MPLFDYRCSTCEATIEVLHRTSGSPPEQVECPCGSHLDRQVAAPAVHFKGDGWSNRIAP